MPFLCYSQRTQIVYEGWPNWTLVIGVDDRFALGDAVGGVWICIPIAHYKGIG